jgi:hypothetical protein
MLVGAGHTPPRVEHLSVFQITVCCDLLVVSLLAVVYDLNHVIWAYQVEHVLHLRGLQASVQEAAPQERHLKILIQHKSPNSEFATQSCNEIYLYRIYL